MLLEDFSINLAAAYAQSGISKVVELYKDKKFLKSVDDYIEIYRNKIFDKISDDRVFEFEKLTDKIRDELLPELIMSQSAPQLRQRNQSKKAFINACYAYAGARTQEKQQAVFEFIKRLFNHVEDYLDSKSTQVNRFSLSSAVEDIADEIKTCLSSLHADIVTLQNNLEISNSYSNSFAEFIDQIAEKPSRCIPFHYSNPNISLFGRTTEMKLLDSFLNGNASIQFCIVSGVGGAGKSKLVYEFVKEHQFDTRWKFVYLDPQRFEKILAFNRWSYDDDLCVIIDYAGSISDLIGQWLRILSNTVRPARPNKLRLVLIERQNVLLEKSGNLVLPQWYETLLGSGENNIIVSDLLFQPAIDQYFINIDPLDDLDISRLIDNYAESVSYKLTNEGKAKILHNLQTLSNGKPYSVTPLFVMFVADAYINNPNFKNWNSTLIIEHIKKRLTKNIRTTICSGDIPLYNALYSVLVYSTAAFQWQAGSILPPPFKQYSDHLNSLETAALNSIIYDLNYNQSEQSRVNRIEPDIIGEFIVLDYLKNNMTHLKEIIKAFWQYPERFLAFIKNAINDYCRNKYFADLLKDDLNWLFIEDVPYSRTHKFEIWYVLLCASTKTRARRLLAIMKSSLSFENDSSDDFLHYARAINLSIESFFFNEPKRVEELVEDFGSTLASLNCANWPDLKFKNSFIEYYVLAIGKLIDLYDNRGIHTKISPYMKILKKLLARYPTAAIQSVLLHAREVILARDQQVNNYDLPLLLRKKAFIEVHPRVRNFKALELTDFAGKPVCSDEWNLYGINILDSFNSYDNFFHLTLDFDRYYDHHVMYYPYEMNSIHYVREDASRVYFILDNELKKVDVIYPDGQYCDQFDGETRAIDLCKSWLIYNEDEED